MLDATTVSKHFGTNRALDGVSLQVAPGDIYCLLGANGAGKTTLVNLFLNFLQPTSGEVRINGLDVARHPLETSDPSPTFRNRSRCTASFPGSKTSRLFGLRHRRKIAAQAIARIARRSGVGCRCGRS